MQHREVTNRDLWRTGLYALAAVVVMAGGAGILVRWAWPGGLIVWLAVCAGGSLLLLVRWHARRTAYRCAACGQTFAIPMLADLASMHCLRRKYLRCPACGERTWAAVLWRTD